MPEVATGAGIYAPDLREDDGAGSLGQSCNSVAVALPWTDPFTTLGLPFLICFLGLNRVLVRITGNNGLTQHLAHHGGY